MTRAELERHLASLSREQLADTVHSLYAMLPSEHRGWLEEQLLRAAVSRGERVPDDPTLSEEVAVFARQRGYADPRELDDLLSRVLRASLAGRHTVVREAIEALIPPLASVEIDLGQDELISDALVVSLDDVGGAYLRSVYCTTVADERAEALLAAVHFCAPLASVWKPVAAMEASSPTQLGGLDAFLPRWLDLLERQQDEGWWYGEMLREALLRCGGLDALAAHARAKADSSAFRDWIGRLIDAGRMREAMPAAREASELIEPYRADYLDLEARLAALLGEDPIPLLKAAFEAKPSYARLARLFGALPVGESRVRVAEKYARRVARHPRLRGVVALVRGDYAKVAKLLGTPRKGGYDNESGALLAPVVARLIAETLGDDALAASVESAAERGLMLGPLFFAHMDETLPRFPVPEPVELALACDARPSERQAARLLEALASYAAGRVDAVAESGRTRGYGPAAQLVGLVAALQRARGHERDAESFVADQRAKAGRKWSLREAIEDHAARSRR